MSYSVSPKIPAKVTEYALKAGLDPILVAAVVLQESAGNPDATRAEPGFYWKYLHARTQAELGGFWPNPAIIPTPFELTYRSTSWGLMQVMGQVARENGFKELSLTYLKTPSLNLGVGTRILAKHLKDHDGDPEKALLRWNGGGNRRYPREVFARIENGEAQKYLTCSHDSESDS